MKIVTHSGKFHTDDVFAVSALFLLYPDREVVRTRDEEIISKADIVVDVGEVYDDSLNRFDHHQLGGAGERGNEIPYSSFGLVWKKFGEEICTSRAIMESIDRFLVSPIDAADNGKDISKNLISGVTPFFINGVVNAYRPTWKEGEGWDKAFLEAVGWASSFLKRQIKIVGDILEQEGFIRESYNQSADKRVVVIDEKHVVDREFINGVLNRLVEPLYAIFQSRDNSWRVLAINKEAGTLELRKPLPAPWRAKHDSEFEEVSGVKGAQFCHRTGFMCVVKSKEAAIKLAELALNA